MLKDDDDDDELDDDDENVSAGWGMFFDEDSFSLFGRRRWRRWFGGGVRRRKRCSPCFFLLLLRMIEFFHESDDDDVAERGDSGEYSNDRAIEALSSKANNPWSVNVYHSNERTHNERVRGHRERRSQLGKEHRRPTGMGRRREVAVFDYDHKRRVRVE